MSSVEYDNEEIEAGSSLPSLAELVCILRKRAPLIGACVCLALAVAIAIAMLIPSQYEATAMVYIEARKKTIVDMDEVMSGLKADNSTIDSEVEVLKSNTVIARVVDELRLWEDKEFSRPERLRDRIPSSLGLGSVAAPATGDAAARTDVVAAGAGTQRGSPQTIDAVSSNLNVHRRGFTYLIEIAFRSRDSVKAARIANAIAEAYLQEQIEAKMHAAEMATFWLDKRIGELKERVFDAERLAEKYKAEHSIVDSEGHPLDEKELARNMEALVEARAGTAVSKAKYDQARLSANSDVAKAANADVLQSPTAASLKSELAKALREQAELRTRYGSKHPAILQADANVKSATEELKAEINRIIANLRSQYEVASGREAEMEQSLNALKGSAATSSQAIVKLHELEREANASRTVYEAFLKRAEETAQQQNLQLPDARIIEMALTPDAPSSPQRIKIAAAGAGGGLAFGLLFAALLELLYPSVVRIGQIEKSLKLRHLTSVPAYGGDGDAESRDSLRHLRRILIAPGSEFSEALRGIRVALEGARDGNDSRVVLIASALPGEGRTVIASNLAHHYALTGAKTLLVDCDMRISALSRALQPEAPAGLMECLLDGTPVQAAIGIDASTGLHFLPARAAGRGSSAVAELLASSAMTEAMALLKQEFDIVICDCPPILPVVDTRILADLSDQIVYVLKWRMTPRALAQKALKSLDANLRKVTGVVINSVAEEQLAQSSGRSLSDSYARAVNRAANRAA